MVYSIASEKDEMLNEVELAHAIRRNFGGLDEIDAVKVFSKHVRSGLNEMQSAELVNTVDLLRASLDHKNAIGESRYLLVITENYSALRIVEQQLTKNKDDYVVIFGSSFPKDQEYTQVCRNINQIKVCMETGRTVVLLNLENLYESLYDALNQYYVYCAGQKYVDLGLGSHRVKCRVDDSFRLIVIAERDVVYKKFPIPLINRLEKHYLVTSKSLDRAQLSVVEELRNWAKTFAQVRQQPHERQQQFEIGDAFIGYQSDTIPAMVLQVCDEDGFHVDQEGNWAEEVKHQCQQLLVQCAAPDAIARLPKTSLKDHADDLRNMYFVEQEHCSLSAYLGQLLITSSEEEPSGLLVQVTTHSRLLSEHDLSDVCQATSFVRRDIELLYLQQFQTEQQFLKQVRDFFIGLGNHEGMLLVQFDSGDENFNLIACTRHLLMDQRAKRYEMLTEKLEVESVSPLHFIIIVQLPRQKGGCANFVGFQGGQWKSVHVDDLRPPSNEIPPIEFLIDRPISDLLKPAWIADDMDIDIDTELTEQGKNLSLDEIDVEMGSEEELEMDVEESQHHKSTDHSLPSPQTVKTTKESFDAIVLLRRSVQAAAGRLEDDSEMANRTTERIDLILNLLPVNSSKMTEEPSFAKTLHQKIYELLVEKNETISGDLAREWVRIEALSGTRMHERGTFRKALQHKVLTDIEPLLAKILAFADRDCNLDLLVNQSPWLSSLWIRIFDNQRLNEKYYEFSDTNKIREHVHMSGRGKHVFKCQFPFSWLIKEVVHDLARGAVVSDRSGGTEEEKLRRIIGNSELSEILALLQEEDKEEEAAMRYLHDFVHMVYYPTQQCQQEEIEVISQFVRMAAEDENKDNVFDFATIHITFNRMQPRINSFSQIVQAEPEVTRLLLEQKRSIITIDIAALLVCLEKLEPSLSDLRNSQERNQWCNKVLAIRSSIEAMTSKEMFARDSISTGGYEKNEKEILQQCWMMWQRLSVLRIFIAHVCNTSLQNFDVANQYISQLSKVLEDNSNFLATRSVRSLEGFLLECRNDFTNRIKICDTTCSICMSEAKRPTVTPCNHCFCYDCVTRWCCDNQTCPKCREPFAAGYQLTESVEIMNAISTLNHFRHQCNSFFMEVVSLFCFGYSPCGCLEEDTYRLLMSYVTGAEGLQTKPFSPFSDEDTMDVTPVVRSFLMQQLLKSSDKKVKEYMDLFINKAQQVVKVGAVEIFALCIQCLEDSLNNKFIKRAIDLPLEHKLSLIGRHCKTASTFWSGPQRGVLNVAWIEGIANTRFSLSLAADLMYESVSQQDDQEHLKVNIQRAQDSIFADVEKICTDPSITTPRLFFLKQFARKYGFESISVLARKFGWILPPEATESIEVSQDRFLVYGTEYQTLRETIAKSVVNGNMGAIEEVLQGMRSGACETNVTLLLAIFQEITANPGAHISDQVMENLKQLIAQSTSVNNNLNILTQELTDEGEDLHESSIKNLFPLAGESPWETSMVEVVIHLAALLFSRVNDGLLGPLVSLAVRPSTCAGSFFPTMPDDPLAVVRTAVLGTLYECSNGHPYLVTECGRPLEKSRCRAPGCGAAIGGDNHVLTTNNRAARTTDRTMKGHCLGVAGNRERQVIPERDLTTLATCLVRLLVHGAMLIGSCYNSQAVAQLISPAIPLNAERKFLWDHVLTDMHLLSRVSGRSVDETALMLHLLLQHIAALAQTQGWTGVLQTNPQRRQWENNFANTVIVPVMSNLGNRLQGTLQLIANDKRFGANPLLRQLYELESGVEDYGRAIQANCSSLWRYRTPITLDHATRKFNEAADVQSADCAILAEFLTQEHEIRAVRFLPEVVKLQKLLMDRFHRSLNRTETDKLKLKDFYKQIPKGSITEYKSLVQSFKSAWNIMVTLLKEKGTKGPLAKLLSQHKVQDSSLISMFIPCHSGIGLCSLTLVEFLVRTNNEFLELYRQNSEVSNLQRVSILEVTHSQLVSYETDRDLLPLLHAHCHYSLEVGQGTLAEYDWPAIQRHLVDRLIRGRSVVDFKPDEYTKTAVVNAESVLTSLKAKIPQVELSLAIQHQIIHQYRSLQDVCEALSSLNIAITFLSSGGGRPDMPITKYLHKVLKLPEDAGLRNHKVQEVCQLQHSVSLWRLLSLERAKLLTRSDKDPFEHLSDGFKEPLGETLKLAVNDTLRKLSDTCLDVFVSSLMEIITIQLNDELDIVEWRLKDFILYHPNQKDAEPIEDAERIPEGVLLKHVFSFWKLVLGFSDRCHTQRIQATG